MEASWRRLSRRSNRSISLFVSCLISIGTMPHKERIYHHTLHQNSRATKKHKSHKIYLPESLCIFVDYTPSLLKSASKSVSKCCATSAKDRSVSACVQPRSSTRILVTRFRKSV